MGDHGGRWMQSDGLLPNGLLPCDDIASVTRVLEQNRWSIAEDRTLQLITCIQPDKRSEERRNSVANYVKRLITNCFSCQVFTFGSVPLKTYLPDGDIDLTAFSKDIDLKDTWANEVREILENEEKNKTAKFHVKEVQYIQAEVKIIKCLVENIVVDVSFNQLGGLCTLCFLEEIDNLIGQDHLFKRSIILIKAWCYYESRVLGAHHGLISTYALETLVLYIFHVFNNSFAGPLEVLYRFLEFFSKFDWDNFCVSLWGPVPISSLPDMTAEPPRKDSGDLLLSHLFLNACSALYAVLPNGQDNQGQPFISKHFNVIDPLRTNNNLGRSVSKGNFYRIRSAFQLGAKRLAGLLECPKESINAEVDKFFTDTWQRHRNGYRPDAIPPNLHQLQALSADSTEDSENISNHTSSVKRVDAGFPDLENGPIALGRISFQHAGINQHEKNVYMAGRPSSFQKEKSCDSQTSCTDDTGRSMSPSVSMQADKYSKNSRPGYLAKDNVGQARLQFARTHSSPELTDNAVSFFGRQNKMAESTKSQLTSVRPDQIGIRKSLAAEVPGGHAVKSIDDSPAHGSSQYSVGTSVDTGSASNRYHNDTSFSVTEEDLASVSQTLELHQEEQDLVNMMASSRFHNLNGQVQLPMHISSRLSVPLAPFIASMGYPQRNMGLVPSNIAIMEPPLGFNMQFHQVPLSAMSSHYLPNAGFEPNSEEIGESGSNVPCTTDISQGDGDSGFCHDVNTGSSQMILPDKQFPIPDSAIKRQSAAGEVNFTISSEASGSASPFKRGQPKNVRGNRGLLKEDHGDASVYPNTNDLCCTHGSVDSRFLPASQGSSPRNKYNSEPWDSPSVKVPKSSRDKRGRRLASPAGSASSYGRAKNGWNYRDSSPDHASVPTDDKSREWSQQSVLSNDVAEKNVASSSLATTHGESYKIPSLESCQMSGSDPVIPVHPMFICAGTPQGIGNGPGLGSIFYPTGPLVPFYTFPVQNLPSDSLDSDGSGNQFDPDTVPLNSSNQNFGLVERPGQPEVLETFSSMKGVSFWQPEHTKLDILNSDFSSHWQNLQFGRFCQCTGPQDFPGFTSPVVVPPIHLQSPFALEGPGRSLPPNVSLLAQNVSHRPQFVPVMPSQAGSDVASDVYQRQGDEVSRYQGGTGTYIPKLKDSFRDRQSFNIRNHRGNYKYNKSDNEDQGNWIGSKSKSSGRNHGRAHFDRPNTRPDRLSSTDNEIDRLWDSNRQQRISSNQAHNNLSTSSSHGSTSMMHGIYPCPAVNSNGVNPVGPTTPFMMMYPRYDPSARHGSSVGQVEFGSFGSGHLSRVSGVPLTVADDSLRSAFEQRSDEYVGGSPCSSPDQPSSPQVQGRR